MKYEVWVAGPDDVYEHDDERAAFLSANRINILYLQQRAEFPDLPLYMAIVREKKAEGEG